MGVGKHTGCCRKAMHAGPRGHNQLNYHHTSLARFNIYTLFIQLQVSSTCRTWSLARRSSVDRDLSDHPWLEQLAANASVAGWPKRIFKTQLGNI